MLTKQGRTRLHDVLHGHVERGALPGLVALVADREDAHVEVLGTRAFGDAARMTRDTIFRIASISKPVTAAAAMLLVEDCTIRLDDPIDTWLPELADRRVLTSLESLDDTVPAKRAITVRDLLTCRMGFGSVMAPPDTYPIQRLIRAYQIGGDGPPHPMQTPGTDEWLRGLGSLPLLAQPGERWLYHVSIDVLGVLIARASGRSLGAFLRERLFEPLGMHDTAFAVPAEKRDRFATQYAVHPQTKALTVFDGVADSEWAQEPAFESGGGGLVSTIDDYLAFARMLLNDGRHGRERVLSRASVALMTSDQVTAQERAGAEIFFGRHSSWGFGMAVAIARDELFRTPGRYGWDGGFGTSAYVDPAEGVVGLLFTQRAMESPEPPALFTDFWTTAYAGLK